jgi:hypothetical protein
VGLKISHAKHGINEIFTSLFNTLQMEIINNPELFVEPDPELPLALLDQKEVCTLLQFCREETSRQ